MVNLALLILRLTVGSLLAGHGAQKLFGWFGGYGLQGTSSWIESLGLKPGKPWAMAAGASEFGGGTLLLLGLLNPVGALATIGAMTMATVKVHLNKPIWNTSGGPELPVINIAAALAVALAGPGDYSLDRLFGIKLPRFLLVPGLVVTGLMVAAGMRAEADQEGPSEVEKPSPEEAGGDLQGGETAAHPA